MMGVMNENYRQRVNGVTTYHDGKDVAESKTPTRRLGPEVLLGNLRHVRVADGTARRGRKCCETGKEYQDAGQLIVFRNITKAGAGHAKVGEHSDEVAVNGERTTTDRVDADHCDNHGDDLAAGEDNADEERVGKAGRLDLVISALYKRVTYKSRSNNC